MPLGDTLLCNIELNGFMWNKLPVMHCVSVTIHLQYIMLASCTLYFRTVWHSQWILKWSFLSYLSIWYQFIHVLEHYYVSVRPYTEMSIDSQENGEQTCKLDAQFVPMSNKNIKEYRVNQIVTNHVA